MCPPANLMPFVVVITEKNSNFAQCKLNIKKETWHKKMFSRR